jgi:hypothetical protein
MFGTGARHDIIHNISKIQLHRTCIFGDTTDLGFSYFYFSCNNYQEKLWTCFKKVVGFFTRNPTKFSLHFFEFSTTFYGFSKIQQKPFTI